MITIKNERELTSMRKACRITAAARALAGEMVRPGVSTKAIDQAVHDFIVSQGAKPSFLNYNGFPASACISVNSTVIHGIPGGYILKEGDIVSVDVGAFYKGFHGDCAATFACGAISTEAQKLIDVTKQSFFEGIKFATKGRRVQDISHAIQTYVESNGFSVVRSFVGHGVGRQLHEEPEVPNFGNPGRGPRLVPGMTIGLVAPASPIFESDRRDAAVRLLEDMGFTDIVISLKSSNVKMNYEAYRIVSEQTDYPLHIGVTEAGTLARGKTKSAAGLGALLLNGIGDTMRISLTADP